MDNEKDSSVEPIGSQPAIPAGQEIPFSSTPTGEDYSHVEIALDLQRGESIQIIIESAPGSGEVQVTQGLLSTAASGRQRAPVSEKIGAIAGKLKPLVAEKIALDQRVFLGVSIFIYLVTRLVALPGFPIYFYCDEAASTVLAAFMANNGLRDLSGTFLPTFFANPDKYSLGTSVYVQLFSYLALGKSIWVTRGVTALLSLLAAYWIARILKDVFKLSCWWSGVLIFAGIPGWFLISRTGFEVSLLVTFYTGFIYYYLLYRTRSPHYLYLAIILGALAFYSYSSGQIVVAFTGLLLLVSDFRYHWQQRKTALAGAGLLLLTALPLARFLVDHPAEYVARLRMYGSYLEQAIPTGQKIAIFLSTYLSGFNPFYWFFPNLRDEPVYIMLGYGHIHWSLLPFTLLGLWQVFRHFRRPEMRVVLAALLAAPAGAASVSVTLTRALTIVIPVALLSVLGLEALLSWLGAKWQRLKQSWVPGALLGFLAFTNLFMLRDALVNGPTWFHDYGIDGMQYGAAQVFPAALSYSARYPQKTVYISPNWTFQSDVLSAFFVPPGSRVRISTVDHFLTQFDPEIDNSAFVLAPWDYQTVINSGKFEPPQVDLTIPYPDGNTGFYFTRLRYRPDAVLLFQRQQELHQTLQESIVKLGNDYVTIKHSQLEDSTVDRIFDGDLKTFMKTAGINPLVIDLAFPEARIVSAVKLHVGSEAVVVRVSLHVTDTPEPIIYTQQFDETPYEDYKDVIVSFDPTNVVGLTVELMDSEAPPDSIVHLWELSIVP
jgi:4-amino-4-deoxy-L-arabinose transferase-like glycosyltransferase